MTIGPGRLTLAALRAASAFGAARADLIASPDLADGVAALPRLTATGLAAASINADLAARDAAQVEFAGRCNTEPPHSFYERFVTVTFVGPAYLSLLDSTGFYCPGAAHPNFGVAPVTYDLATGDEVKWQAVFPTDLLAEDGHPWSGAVKATPAVVAVYFAHATAMDAECREEIADDPVYFRVWLDAAEAGLVLMPSSLPHAMQACADPVTLPLASLRAHNFDPGLLAALRHPDPVPKAARQRFAAQFRAGSTGTKPQKDAKQQLQGGKAASGRRAK